MSCTEHNCSCHHEHHKQSRQSYLFLRLGIGTILFILALIFKSLPLFLIAYAILGYDVLFAAVKGFPNILGESFLMSLATIGAFLIGEFPEAVAVMLFYQIGELLSHKAVHRSKKSIESLMDLRTDTAKVLKNGEFITALCCDINVGDIIQVTAGERVPLDGDIVSGSAYFDTSAITGEAKPVKLSTGEAVTSGTICTDSLVEIKVTTPFSQSTVSKILELVKTQNQSEQEKFITRFARIYTPIVVILALIIAIIPPFFIGNREHFIYIALLFLVVSCPCALVVSVPLTFFAGIGGASRHGILVKGGYALENLALTKNLAFDKTGTLTEGSFRVQAIRTNGIKAQLLEYAAYAEYYSNHPIANAILKEYKNDIDTKRISDYREIAGYGVKATVDSKTILAGSEKLMAKSGIDTSLFANLNVYLAVDGKCIGGLEISDAVKTEALDTVLALKNMDINSVILTGDSEKNARPVADELNCTLYASLLPQDKAAILKELEKTAPTAFAGDGINDAPSLSQASSGISMGMIGSDAAIEASDIVIMGDDISKIPVAIKIARKTLKIAKENIWFAILIKVGIMILGVLGYASMWLSVFADAGVCLLAVLNSLRAFKD